MTDRLFGVRAGAGWLAGAQIPKVGMPAPATATDLRSLCTYSDNQIGDRCVGDMLEGGRWMAVRGKGQRGSPRGLYMGARAREVARAQTASIPDIGCYPQDAIEAAVDVGVFPRDARDDDYAQVTALDTWSEAVAKVQMRPTDFAPVGSLDEIDSWLTAGFGVGVWFPVDAAWSKLTAAAPTWPGLQGPAVGGHATVLAGYPGRGDSDPYFDWNSYGLGWGANGFALIPRSVLRATIQGAVAILGGPIL